MTIPSRPTPRATARPAPVAAAEPAPTVTRQDVTDRLGLPVDATDDEVLAAVDGQMTVEARAWGVPEALPAPDAPAAQMTADELYAAAWGADS